MKYIFTGHTTKVRGTVCCTWCEKAARACYAIKEIETKKNHNLCDSCYDSVRQDTEMPKTN